MTIGIIGSGGIGRALAVRLAAARLEAKISNRRGPESLAGLVRELGPAITAVRREEAAAADIVFVAVPWNQAPAALTGVPAWNQRIVVDCTNPIEHPGFQVVALSATSSEVIREMVPGARVVKAFNTLPAEILGADPHEAGGRRVIFQSGDESTAKSVVGRLIDRMGFHAIDLGGLAEGGKLQQFPGGALASVNLIRMQ